MKSHPAPTFADLPDVLAALAAELDAIEVGFCLLDDNDCSQLWNDTFLRFFPEHDGKVFRGEHYSENLRRFYSLRLSPAELPDIERYVEAGIARHRSQARPYVFEHLGRRFLVTSFVVPGQGRVRLWRRVSQETESSLSVQAFNLTRAESQLPVSSTLLLDRIPDGVMICGVDESIEWVNQPFLHLYGLRARAVPLGLRFDDVYRMAWKDHLDDDDPRLMRELNSLRDGLSYVGAPFEIPLPGDRYVRVIARPGEDGRTFFDHVDITELRRQQQRLADAESAARRAANRDSLTGLMNRRMFMEWLTVECSLARRTGRPFALLFLDLDGFKPINDIHGHAVGDRALEHVANVMRATLRDSDGLARLGGDEFVVLMRGLERPQAALDLSRRLIQWVNQPFFVDNVQLTVGLSVGIALCPDHGDQPDTLLQCADRAMYAAKNQGRNMGVFYTGSVVQSSSPGG